MPEPLVPDPTAPRRAVLVTRPQDDAAPTAQLLQRRGYDPVIAPLLTVTTRRLAIAASYDALVVTSRNAVPALPARLAALPVMAVGTATAGALARAGFAHVHDAQGDAGALADLIRRTLPAAARLLFVHGEGQGDALAAALQAAGFPLDREVGYVVRPVPAFPAAAAHALGAGRVHAAMFLSADTARAFVGLLPAELRPHLADVAAVAIGHAAAAVLAPLPWHEVRVSVRPTLDEVMAQL